MRSRCLKTIYALAKEDPRIIFIGSDLGVDALKEFKSEMPDRFFMEGISEAHIIGMAAGLAKEGFIPYINTIATFLTRRCYEQIAIDLCLHNLPVRLLGSGGGLVYAPLGPTHLATDDIGLMRLLPNMTILAPADADEMEQLLQQSVSEPGPIYVRIGKGGEPKLTANWGTSHLGQNTVINQNADIMIVSAGVMTHRAIKTASLLQALGINCGVIHIHRLKPVNTHEILSNIKNVRLVVVFDEHNEIGGLGSLLCEILVAANLTKNPRIMRFGVDGGFVDKYGSQDQLMDHYGMNPKEVADKIYLEFIESAQLQDKKILL